MINPESGIRPPQDETQGQFSLGLPIQRTPEELMRADLVDKAGKVSLMYAERVSPILRGKIRRGEGLQVIASNEEGRPGEELIDLDQIGETVLKSVIREVQLPTVLMSENTPEPTEFGNGSAEKLFTYGDPLDNSSQAKRGLDTVPYSVKGDYDKEGKPKSAVVVDFMNNQAYINIGRENFLYDLETKERRPLHKSNRTSLKDKDSTLATFLGEKEYSEMFFRYFGGLVNAPDRERKALLYSGGGAYIYGLLASGAVDAYVMFNEPVSEIIPGLPLALAAGCTVVCVNMDDGTYEDFKFDPNAMRANYKLYSEGTVPLFIAAATPEIRDEIIKSFMDQKKANEQKAKLQQTKDEFIEEKKVEFEVFRGFRDLLLD